MWLIGIDRDGDTPESLRLVSGETARDAVAAYMRAEIFTFAAETTLLVWEWSAAPPREIVVQHVIVQSEVGRG